MRNRSSPEALELYREAEASWNAHSQWCSKQYPQYSLFLRDYAECLYEAGQREAAFEQVMKLLDGVRQRFILVGQGLPESEAIQWTATNQEGLDLVCSLALAERRPSWAADAWDALIRLRALVLDENGRTESGVAAWRIRRCGKRRWRTRRSGAAMAHLVINCPTRKIRKPTSAWWTVVQTEKTRLEEILAAKSHPFRRSGELRPDWPERT